MPDEKPKVDDSLKGVLSNLPLDEKIAVFVGVSMPREELNKKLQGIPKGDNISRILAIREAASGYFQPLINYLNERGIPYSEIPIVGTVETALTAQQINELANEDYVVRISEKNLISPS